MSYKPRLLMISHVLPFPRTAGQRQRVYYTLRAARDRFHVTFAGFSRPEDASRIRHELLPICDEVKLLPTIYSQDQANLVFHRAIGFLYSLATGLKRSNYVLGHVELSPRRVAELIGIDQYDCVLFQYWHAWRAAASLRGSGMVTLLDTHNVLWRARQRELDAEDRIPRRWRRRVVERYRACEERAWEAFDALIAINREEYKLIRERMPNSTIFYCPMGINMEGWPYGWEAPDDVRIAYYGGLGSPHNQRDALTCYREIMPEVWKTYPSAELWIVGSNPPASLVALQADDSRVRVTGFVEDVPVTLRAMSLVLCPWTGTYGFRSRLVEVMALGVPLVASSEAVAGMDLEHESGILLSHNPTEMAAQALRLLTDRDFALRQSRLGRERVETIYNYDITYVKMVDKLYRFAGNDTGRDR